jgi:hypothetical protein
MRNSSGEEPKSSRWVAVGVGSMALALSLALTAISTASAGEQPTISGTVDVGQVLTASPVADTGIYKWQSCDPAIASCVDAPAADANWVHIAGANAQTYLVTRTDRGHYLRVLTKGTSIGEQFAASEPVGPVPGPPQTQVQAQAQAGGLEPHHGNDFLIDSGGGGPVLIKPPGHKKFVPVQSLLEIPFGSIVRADGFATIVSERGGDGADETAQFWGGTFKAQQSPDAGSYFVAKLRSKLHCGSGNDGPPANKASSGPIAVAASGGRLWGSSHGKFRTRGGGRATGATGPSSASPKESA